MKIQYVILLLIFFFTSCYSNSKKDKYDVSVLSTDLSLDKDPDDWFDVFVFLTTQGINPKGIILDYYATDTVCKKLQQFLEILNVKTIEIKKGFQSNDNINNYQKKHREGADFILNTMKKTKGKVNLIAVGTLRNEAFAYTINPKLFKSKIKYLYFAGGNPDGISEVNVSRGLEATKTLFNSDIPIIWIPCTQEMKQKLTAEQELIIQNQNSKLSSFFTELLATWRIDRGEHWLSQTDQTLGKNLWSIPAFLHLAGLNNFDLKFKNGTTNYDNFKGTNFSFDINGGDVLLINRNENEITNWLTNTIINFNSQKQQ